MVSRIREARDHKDRRASASRPRGRRTRTIPSSSASSVIAETARESIPPLYGMTIRLPSGAFDAGGVDRHRSPSSAVAGQRVEDREPDAPAGSTGESGCRSTCRVRTRVGSLASAHRSAARRSARDRPPVIDKSRPLGSHCQIPTFQLPIGKVTRNMSQISVLMEYRLTSYALTTRMFADTLFTNKKILCLDSCYL